VVKKVSEGRDDVGEAARPTRVSRISFDQGDWFDRGNWFGR
jgi:hypothetical protein